jgi:hypothetical protein
LHTLFALVIAANIPAICEWHYPPVKFLVSDFGFRNGDDARQSELSYSTAFRDPCKSRTQCGVVSGPANAEPEICGIATKQSRRSLDTTPFAEISFQGWGIYEVRNAECGSRVSEGAKPRSKVQSLKSKVGGDGPRQTALLRSESLGVAAVRAGQADRPTVFA